MSRIFLSHSSRDNFEAIAARDWLASEGWDDVFLDLDPDRGIAAGERWERALHAAANRCEAVIFLVSGNWLASGWCRKEYELARGLNKKLFAVLISPATKVADLPAELTGTWQVINVAGGRDLRLFRVPLPGSHEEKHVGFSQDGLRRLKRGLEKAGLDPKYFLWPPENEPSRAPYRGLKPLEGSDAGIFFGRDAPIVEASDRLRGLHGGAPPRLLVILGASGAGKSSFLRAGLLPRLARDDTHFLPLPTIRPERAALSGESGLLGALEAAFPSSTRAALRSAITDGASGVRPLLAELVAHAQSQRPMGDERAKPPAIVIAVDQAEELFRAEGGQEGAGLLDLLRTLTGSDDPPVIAMFAIRSDAYDALEHAKPLEGLPQATVPLLPMPRGAFTDVITGPARRIMEAGGTLAIEPQLTQRLLEDIEKGGGSDALPLLAFTLEQLYLEYGRAGALRFADYQAFGGLKGAIDAAVERAFVAADADPRIPRDRAAREALLRRGLIPWLAGIDPDTKSPRRNIARRADLPAEAAPLIDLLVEERLLSTDTLLERDPTTQQEIRVATVEPAHEALLRQWGLLQGWLEEDFAVLATLEGVKRGARDWDANARAEAWLAHQGQRLGEALGLDARPDIAAKLDAVDRAYFAGCRDREEAVRAEAELRRQEREEEQARRLADAQSLASANRRTARRTRLGFVAATVLALTAAVFGFYAQRQATIADNRTKEVQLQRQAAEHAAKEAEVAREEANDRALEAKRNQAAALTGLANAAVISNPARAVKLALAAWPRRPHAQAPKLDVTVSILAASMLELRERRILRGHNHELESAEFSPDGTRIVTASRDATARLWDAATGKQLFVLKDKSSTIIYLGFPKQAATFSHDGARILTTSERVRVWDASNGKLVAILDGDDFSITTAQFSPDGMRIVTDWVGGTAQVWDAASGKPLVILRGHDKWVRRAAFFPDGKRIITTSSDGTARVWDAASGKPLIVLKGHTEPLITDAVFSPDGTRVVTASADSTARLWDAATGNQLTVLDGHRDTVWSAAYSPDGTRIVTASSDATARLWNSATGKPLAVLNGHGSAVTRATFSPDGSLIVTSSNDKTARVWDGKSGKPLAVLSGHGDKVFSAAFSPDGTHIVTASSDKTARIWEIGLPFVVLRGGTAAFAPDGTRIVTSTDDGEVRLWDTAGKPLASLKGHSDSVSSAGFSPDGSRIVTASVDHTARLWNAATGEPLAILKGHSDSVLSAGFSPDGTRIVTASKDHTARLWKAATGEPLAILKGHTSWVQAAAFSPDGSRIITVGEPEAILWDAATGKSHTVLEGATVSAAFSPDGTRIVTASLDETARVWDAATGKPLAILKGHHSALTDAAFSPDGTRIVTASKDSTVRIWDAATGNPLAILKSPVAAILNAAWSATFSPDGTRIATVTHAFSDSISEPFEGVLLWDAATAELLTILKGQKSVILSPDGNRIVTSSSKTTATTLWDIAKVPKGNLFQVACAWLPDHDLTDIAREYGLTNLEPICEDNPPLPDVLTK